MIAILVVAAALVAQASASPSPSPTPTAPSDPCGSILSIVNRPSVTTGVCTVRPGHYDVEMGYTNTTTSGIGGGSGANYPQPLVRFGTGPHFDVELGPASYQTTSVGTSTISGWSDVNIGAKYEAGYSSNADWGLNTVVTFPTGTRGFSAGNAQFTGNLNGALTLSPVFGLSGTLSFNALSGLNSAGRAQSYFAFIPSILLSAGLPGSPSQLSAEYAYYSSAGPNLGAKSLVDFIYQRDFGGRVQLDVEYGFSPTTINGQTQHYVGAGLAFMN